METTKSNLIEIASNRGLKLVHLSNNHWWPDTDNGAVEFASYEEAEAFADEFGLDVSLARRRAGWDSRVCSIVADWLSESVDVFHAVHYYFGDAYTAMAPDQIEEDIKDLCEYVATLKEGDKDRERVLERIEELKHYRGMYVITGSEGVVEYSSNEYLNEGFYHDVWAYFYVVKLPDEDE